MTITLMLLRNMIICLTTYEHNYVSDEESCEYVHKIALFLAIL